MIEKKLATNSLSKQRRLADVMHIALCFSNSFL